MPQFTVRPLAWREINAQIDYLEEHAGLQVAERFLEQLTLSFKTLARMPEIGIRCGFNRPSLSRFRRWPVKGHEDWLIFYRLRREGVEIVHVLHGSRDIKALLNPGI